MASADTFYMMCSLFLFLEIWRKMCGRAHYCMNSCRKAEVTNVVTWNELIVGLGKDTRAA